MSTCKRSFVTDSSAETGFAGRFSSGDHQPFALPGRWNSSRSDRPPHPYLQASVRCLQSRKIHPFLVQDNIADFLSERWMFISPRKNGDPIRVGEDDLFIGCGSAKSIKQVCCFALTFHYICII